MTPVWTLSTTALLREWLALERAIDRDCQPPEVYDRHTALEDEIDARIPTRDGNTNAPGP